MYSIDPFYTVETLEIYTFIIPPSFTLSPIQQNLYLVQYVQTRIILAISSLIISDTASV